VAAADQVGVRGEEAVPAHGDGRGREDLAVEPEVRVVPQDDVPVLAGQDRPPAQEHAVADRDAPVARALGVEDHQVVHYHVVAQADLLRMAQHDPVAEGHVAAHGRQQPAIRDLPERQSQGAGDPGKERDHQLVEDEVRQAAAADDEVLVLREGGAARRGHRLLDPDRLALPRVGRLGNRLLRR
jgi:hypothetical protein